MDLIEDMLEKLLDVQKSYQDSESQNIRILSEITVLRQQMEHSKAREQGYLEQLRSLSNTIQELESDRRNILLKKQSLEPGMYEKTIKGRTYYINEDNELFERLYDGGVGNKVGDIKIREGKTIVCWI